MIGVVILNYNSKSDTLKCLEYILRQEGVDLNINVVDNSSTSSADVEELRKVCNEKSIKFHQAPFNKGYNAGNNIGIREAIESGCDAILIANPDMEFHDEKYISILYDELIKRPECAAISGAILSPDGKYQTPMKRDNSWRESLYWIKDFLFPRKKVSEQWADFIDNPLHPHKCHKLSGCSLMLRSDYLMKHGLFDEKVFLYCEEAILSRQIESAGYIMYYTPAVCALHRHVSKEKGDSSSRFRHWKASRLYFIRRYSSWPWYGRMIASLSFRLYSFVMITINRIRS